MKYRITVVISTGAIYFKTAASQHHSLFYYIFQYIIAFLKSE